jgi:hypothetical protein
MNGVSERDSIRQTGHKSAEMLARYICIGEMFTRNATAKLGICPPRKEHSQVFPATEADNSIFAIPNHAIAPKQIRRTS